MDFSNCNGSRSWVVNGKVIDNIVIYKDGNIISNIQRSWIEFCTPLPAGGCHYNDLRVIDEIENVKNARKVDLSRTDCFLCSHVLYIYGPTINATIPEARIFKKYSDGITRYMNFFSIGIHVNGSPFDFLINESKFLDIDGRSEERKNAEELISLLGISDDDVSYSSLLECISSNKESLISALNKF